MRDVGVASKRTAVTPVLSAASLPHQPHSSAGTERVSQRAERGRNRQVPLDDWVSRPLRRDEVIRRARDLDRTELLVGRVAMIAATLLLLNEVVTGDSILEQVTEVLSGLMS
jgi:hypothetical protein